MLAAPLYFDGVDFRTNGDKSGDNGFPHYPRPQQANDLRILTCQMTRANAGNGSGTVRRQQVGRHMGQRRTRFHIIQGEHQDRAR